MKANGKRKVIFDDAVDLLTGGVESANGDGVRMLAVDSIKPYHCHPFRLYEGERLDDMVDSIKEHGVLNPVIVNETSNGFEMLSGHNRQNAARLAGVDEIPAIVKKNLTDEEAYIYVIETNVIQRSFAELLPSEKAAVMSEHYQRICGTMKRDEILHELHLLNDKKDGGHNDHRAKTRDIVAAEYGFSSRNAARYMRINYLIQPFKELIDENGMALLAGVDISYLSEEEQQTVWTISDNMGWKIKPKVAAELRKQTGKLTEQAVADVFESFMETKSTGVKIQISGELRKKYFAGMDQKEILTLIDQALGAWFQSGKRTNAAVA